MSENITVPLVVVALEIGATPDELAKELGDAVLVDAAGIRIVERFIAGQVIDRHAARQAAHRRGQAARQARRDQFKAQHQASLDALHSRLASRAARDRELLRGDDTLSAHTVMVGADHNARMDAAGRRWDAMLRAERTGELVYHSIGPTRKD